MGEPGLVVQQAREVAYLASANVGAVAVNATAVSPVPVSGLLCAMYMGHSAKLYRRLNAGLSLGAVMVALRFGMLPYV